MPVVFAVRDIDIEADTGLVYFDVDFWPSLVAKNRGDAPFVTEDFRMQLSRTVTRVVTDVDGRLKRLDGVFVPPDAITPEDEAIGWERETVQKTVTELRQEVRANILRHADLLEARTELRGDRRLRAKPRVRVDDPDGIRATLSALREARA